MSADYVISTELNLGIDNALRNISTLESKLKSLSKNSISIRTSSLKENTQKTPTFLDNFKSVFNGFSTSFDAIQKITQPLISAFSELYSIAKKLAIPLAGLTTYLVVQADKLQSERNQITSLTAAMFSHELDKGTVSMKQLGDVSTYLMRQFRDLGNKYGISQKEVAHIYETQALTLRKFGGSSIEEIMKFSDKLLKAMPVMKTTTQGQVLLREMSTLLTGNAKNMMPLVYRDIAPLTGMRAEQIDALSFDKRLEIVKQALDKLGKNAIQNTNTISGQFNILMNNVGGSFLGLEKKFVDFMQSINAFASSDAGKSMISHVQSQIYEIIKIFVHAGDVVLKNFGYLSNLTPTASERLSALGDAFKDLIFFLSEMAKGVAFVVNVLSKIFHFFYDNDFVRFLFMSGAGAISGAAAAAAPAALFPPAAPAIIASGGVLGGIFGGVGSSIVSLYKADKDTQSLNPLDSFSKELDLSAEKILGLKSVLTDKKAPTSNTNVTNNNQITVNLESDLPPDLIADSIAEAMRRAAMTPTSSSRAHNVHALAR